MKIEEREYKKWIKKIQEVRRKELYEKKSKKPKSETEKMFIKYLEEKEIADENFKDVLNKILYFHSSCEFGLSICLINYFAPYIFLDRERGDLFQSEVLDRMSFGQKRVLFNKILEGQEELKLNIKELNEIRNKFVHEYFSEGFTEIEIKINNKTRELNLMSKESCSKITHEIEKMSNDIDRKINFLFIKINERNDKMLNLKKKK